MGRILLVLDADGDHRPALRWALADAARRAPCTVAVVAVASAEGLLSTAPREPLVAWTPAATTAPPVRARARERAHRRDARHHEVQVRLDRLLATSEVPEGVTTETAVVDHAQHRSALARRAESADLVVLDAAGAFGEARLAHDLLRDAGVPVVLVP